MDLVTLQYCGIRLTQTLIRQVFLFRIRHHPCVSDFDSLLRVNVDKASMSPLRI